MRHPQSLKDEMISRLEGALERLSIKDNGYNERISMKLKGMSPVQYRTHSQAYCFFNFF